jgi:hypothetical protein
LFLLLSNLSWGRESIRTGQLVVKKSEIETLGKTLDCHSSSFKKRTQPCAITVHSSGLLLVALVVWTWETITIGKIF